jgi:endonuclease/exonuclease/phosphatase (EEP) superfamily protein YafD
VLAVGYLLALLGAVLGLRLVGERWWATTAALYLPRVWLALPLPFITLALLAFGPRRLLLTQVLAAALLAFPLLGLSLSLARAPTPGASHLRVLSYNVATGPYGTDKLMAQLRGAKPDLILLQESSLETNDAVRAAFPGFFLRADSEYLLASRFPIAEVAVAPPVPTRYGRDAVPPFVRYRLTTPTGPISLWSVHATSPHTVLEDMRGEGLRRELTSGRLFVMPTAPAVAANALLRAGELETIAAQAAASADPVIIAGDTNSPGLSWALGHWLGRFQDAFAVVGNGLGYTFPAPKRPWMRIDRVLVGPNIRVLAFEVLPRGPSDHLGVVADLELP